MFLLFAGCGFLDDEFLLDTSPEESLKFDALDVNGYGRGYGSLGKRAARVPKVRTCNCYGAWYGSRGRRVHLSHKSQHTHAHVLPIYLDVDLRDEEHELLNHDDSLFEFVMAYKTRLDPQEP